MIEHWNDPFRVIYSQTLRGHVQQAQQRLWVVGVCFVLCFGAIALRLIDLGTRQNDEGTPVLSPMESIVTRSDIVDRHGEIIATSLVTPSLYANPSLIIDPQEAATKICQVIPELNIEEVRAKLASDKRFVWVQRNLTPTQEAAINRLGIPGLYFRREEKRLYPHGPLFAHVIGYTDRDNRGIAGLEQRFQEHLAKGQAPLQTSLDRRVQHILREKLRQGMVTYSAKGAYGLVMDVNNGELLALVSLQDFDPNKAGSADPKNLFNNVTSACFEMGSTFKIFTTAMVLDSGVATLDSLYDATQPLVLGRFRVRDDHPRNAWLNVAEIFMYSSNIGCAKMARDLGVSGQRAFFEKIGFLKPVTCEIPEVAAPLLPSNWNEISLQTISYGYGLAVSLLHVAAGTASIVNGGYFYQPTLVAGANNNAKPVKVVSEETSRIIRHLMRLVVQEGTGRKSSVRGYSVGGKTGSARKVGEGGYKHGTIMASFISVFPIEEKPRYLVYVVLNEPKGTSETYQHVNGGWNAGPITASVIEEIAPLLGVEPKEEVMPVRARVPLVSVAAVVP